MAKHKHRTSAPAKLVKPLPIGPGLMDVETSDGRVRYAFPTVVRCPRCDTVNTVARATNGPVQYRMCRNAVCRHGDPSGPAASHGAWKISGKLV